MTATSSTGSMEPLEHQNRHNNTYCNHCCFFPYSMAAFDLHFDSDKVTGQIFKAINRKMGEAIIPDLDHSRNGIVGAQKGFDLLTAFFVLMEVHVMFTRTQT